MAVWCEIKLPNGKDSLLNVDACLMVVPDDSGMAMAVSLVGASVPVGASFATVKEDLLFDPDIIEERAVGRKKKP